MNKLVSIESCDDCPKHDDRFPDNKQPFCEVLKKDPRTKSYKVFPKDCPLASVGLTHELKEILRLSYIYDSISSSTLQRLIKTNEAKPNETTN